MHRFYLPPDQCQGNLLALADREAHHALHVLRLRAGERLMVLDGAGQELLCEAQPTGRDSLNLIVAQRQKIAPPACPITLVQAIPKGKLIESIIQKATELGVHRVVPLVSDRVAVVLDDESAAAKAEKWRQTAIEAIKQCGSAWLPQIDAPLTPRQFLAAAERFDLVFIGSLQPDAKHPRTYFQTFHREQQRPPRSVAVWIGPEGDFTPAEMAAAKSAGALPITLGRLVLRSETAATYALSVLNYELQAPPG